MKLSIGTAQFGMSYGISNYSGQISLPDAKEILQFAYENDISDLDTAAAYGEAEANLGQIGIQNFRITTKLARLPNPVLSGDVSVSAWVRSETLKSLQLLGQNEVYGLLLHQPADLFGNHGKALLHALEDVKSSGLTQKLGISVYDSVNLPGLMALKNWDLVQAPLNIFDRRLQHSGWLDRLKDKGVEIHSRSVFLQGLLLTEMNTRPQKFKQWQSIWNEWDGWHTNRKQTKIGTCLAYISSVKQVDRVVIGVDSLVHLKEIITQLKSAGSLDWPNLAIFPPQLLDPSRWSEL